MSDLYLQLDVRLTLLLLLFAGPTGTTLKHDALPSYTLRVTEPKLCDPDVKQYSGYLDTEDKHFFFCASRPEDGADGEKLLPRSRTQR
jgi:hypothetical protein